jgi:AraC-like DNA-binding protein
MENDFRIAGSPSLSNTVFSFWQTKRETGFQTEIIIPKGIVEIIFNLSDHNNINAQFGNRQYQLPLCFINGINTHPVQLRLPQHQFFFGIRFHPTAIKTIFKIPAGEFANHSADLTLIDPSVLSLWHQLMEQPTFNDKILLVTKWLSSKVKESTYQETMLNHFLNDTRRDIPSVMELSKIICYSPRQLSRKLNELSGLNTEEILLYKKYMRSLDLMQHTNLSLTEIAYSCRFADQSHFIKTFKSLAAMTPGDYRKSKGTIPGHIYKDVR